MKDNVLFINRDKAEIDEFRNAMREYEFEIDTADTGLDAAILLRKKNYKVVITGMNLSTYDGIKILAYLNGHCPYTACIVYTTRIDLAQLRVLVNKRKVFRIFLKPVNYRGDFYNAIKDGFTYYDLKEAEVAEQRKRAEREREEEAVETSIISSQIIEWEQMRQYLKPLISWSIQSFHTELSEEMKIKLAEFEGSILDYYLREDYQICKSLEEIRTRMCQEFQSACPNTKIEMEVNQKPIKPKKGFYEQLYFVIWLLVGQITDIFPESEIKIKLDFQVPFRPVVQVTGKGNGEKQKDYWKEEFHKRCMEVVSEVVEAIAGKCTCEMTGEIISYQMQMWAEERKRKQI